MMELNVICHPECNIPPVKARAGTAFPSDVPSAVEERSEAEWSRPEAYCTSYCTLDINVTFVYSLYYINLCYCYVTVFIIYHANGGPGLNVSMHIKTLMLGPQKFQKALNFPNFAWQKYNIVQGEGGVFQFF
jgi:hypothetical protein